MKKHFPKKEKGFNQEQFNAFVQTKRDALKYCYFNGNLTKFDYCSTYSLDEALKNAADKFKHITSGYIYFLDGNKIESEKLLHFFVKI